MTRWVAVVALLVLAGGCGGGPDSGSDGASRSEPSTTAVDAKETGGLAGADPFVDSLVGGTYADAAAKGVAAHQRSDFGQFGSWTLFTVEREGTWYAFTSVNQRDEGEVGMLADGSTIVSGELLEPLRGDDWYGVEGVVRDGRSLGGVMMQGRGFERESDGTFPVLAAWRVNLETLKLEPSSIAGLDIIESCG